MGCGAFLLSNYQPELYEMVPPDACVMYESMEDAYEKASFYLKHDTERERIARRGREVMLRDFTYESRIREMFDTVGIH